MNDNGGYLSMTQGQKTGVLERCFRRVYRKGIGKKSTNFTPEIGKIDFLLAIGA